MRFISIASMRWIHLQGAGVFLASAVMVVVLVLHTLTQIELSAFDLAAFDGGRLAENGDRGSRQRDGTSVYNVERGCMYLQFVVCPYVDGYHDVVGCQCLGWRH